MNEEIDEEEFEALLVELQEINTKLKGKETTAEQIRNKYEMSKKLVYDIRDINPSLLEKDKLREIASLLRTEERRKIGSEYTIGIYLIKYIQERLGIQNFKETQHYAELYEQVQEVWKRVGNGETIACVAKAYGLDTEKVEGLLYPYHELIRDLHRAYKGDRPKSILLPNTKQYNFGPEVLEYIKSGNPVIDANIDKELIYYKRRMGISIGDNVEGGKEIEL